jgi:hypothetical protein
MIATIIRYYRSPLYRGAHGDFRLYKNQMQMIPCFLCFGNFVVELSGITMTRMVSQKFGYFQENNGAS